MTQKGNGKFGKSPNIIIPPAGKVTFTLQVYKGKIIIDFKKNITWIGLGPDDGRRLGQALIKIANDMEGRSSIIPGDAKFILKDKDGKEIKR